MLVGDQYLVYFMCIYWAKSLKGMWPNDADQQPVVPVRSSLLDYIKLFLSSVCPSVV